MISLLSPAEDWLSPPAWPAGALGRCQCSTLPGTDANARFGWFHALHEPGFAVLVLPIGRHLTAGAIVLSHAAITRR
jgi:hypothetical protein